MRELFLTNTLSRTKEPFRPVTPGHVGMYVCGPTVYGEAHLGHARPGVTYDVLFRLLRHLGYRVRYVRNITDVGHLEYDSDDGEDKITKKAKIEDLEPMEVVQTYTEKYHEAMRMLNCVPPSIEPRASGHIPEQIEMVQKILDAGYAYVSNGSVYFDVEKYDRDFRYGVLSGRSIEATLEGTRSLDGQGDKKAPYDFALWKKAGPEHIMRWNSPWGKGFPGWHLECSVMGEKYLGREFDIHGGGMDLTFPHHECEIAQNETSRGTAGVRYWIHNNMVTINGKKMGKSLGNFITLPELFSGRHEALDRPYSPMAVRFFILQAHYRSTLDFSNEALQAAEKGYKRIMQTARRLREMAGAAGVVSPVRGTEGNPAWKMVYGELSAHIADDGCKAENEDVREIYAKTYEALCDDMNTPVALSRLFDAVRIINSAKENPGLLSAVDIEVLLTLFDDVVYGVLGLRDEEYGGGTGQEKTEKALAEVMDVVLGIRKRAREAGDWSESDRIRDALKAAGITVKDSKNGSEWSLDQS